MRFSELKQEFAAAGCYDTGRGKRHAHWFSPLTGQIFPMSRHDGEEVKKGMEMKLRKLAGVKKKR